MKSFDRPHKQLERKRGLFLRFGLLISLLITFLAFEWKTASPRIEITGTTSVWDAIDEEIIPVTWQQQTAMLPEMREVNKNLSPQKENPNPVIIPDDKTPIDVPADSGFFTGIIPIIEKPEKDTTEDDFVYAAEINPEFPGREEAMQRYLERNLRYPEMARREGMEGTVYVNFIIDEKGNVVNVECLRSPGPVFTEEALRVIKQMPRWKPGIQGGKPVRVKMAIPVSFRLL